MEWISIKVHGQSFMLHQIRKLIGLAILMIKTETPSSLIPRTFTDIKINIPRAPPLGLLLERTVFSGYNARIKKTGGENLSPITFTPHEALMTDFKEKEIYSRIIAEETREAVFEYWVRGIEERAYDYSWFLRPDGTIDESLKPTFNDQ
jgi:tRNA pseudouridine38-40 synthase